MKNTKLKTLIQALIDEVNEVKGEKDGSPQKAENWWRMVNWREPDMRTIYDSLSDGTKKLITDDGLCPDCPEKDEPRTEEERAMSHFKITEEEWQKLSKEEKEKFISQLPPRGMSGKEKFPVAPKDENPPSNPVPCMELLKKEHPDWSDAKIAEYCKEAESIDAKKKEPPKETEEEKKEEKPEMTPEEKEEEEKKKKAAQKQDAPIKKKEAPDPRAVLERASKLFKN